MGSKNWKDGREGDEVRPGLVKGFGGDLLESLTHMRN